MTMCQQAGWAQAAGLQENTERGVWSLRVWGGGWCGAATPSAPQPPYFTLPSGLQSARILCSIFLLEGQQVALPRGLSYSLVSQGNLASLKELCLRQLHPFLPSSLSLSVATSPGLALHLVSVHRPPAAPKSACPPNFPPSNPPALPHLGPAHPPSTASVHCLGLPASLVSLVNAGNSFLHKLYQ